MTKQRLLIDEKVEVRSTEDGFLGSWHCGTVISFEKGMRLIQYDHLLSDNNDKFIESVHVNNVLDGVDCMLLFDCCYRGLIRPLSPLIGFDMWGVKYGQCVDAYYRDAWWEGVVFDHCEGGRERSVFFPDIGDELRVSVGSMRVSQDWDECTGVWNVRGKWLFFDLIDEFEKEGWPIVVSVKQIWYDVRVKTGFVENVKEWTCLRSSDVWRGLLEEVLVDNVRLTVKELCRELEFSGVKGLEECYESLEVDESVLYDLIKGKTFDEFSGNEVVSPEDEAQQSGPLQIVAVDSNIDDELYKDSSCSKYGDSCKSSGKVLKKSKHNIWFFADIAPKCCDDAVEVYLNCQFSTNSKQIPHEVTIDLRRHLLFLGWKVEYIQKKGFRRWRYTQPDDNGKCYNSLVKVCEQIRKSDSTKVSRCSSDEMVKLADATVCEDSRNPVNEQNRLSYAADPIVLTPLAEKFQGCENELVKNYSGKFEYCPQAVIDYSSLGIKETRHPKDHDKVKDVQLKAKNHLRAVGWKLYAEYKKDRKSKEIRYKSPWGKLYFSLRSACKSYLDENRNVLKLADALFAGEGQCLTTMSEEFHGKQKKKRTKSARHLASGPLSLMPLENESNLTEVQDRDNLNILNSNHVLGSRKSAREVAVPSSDHRNPRTVLSWLVGKNVVSVKTKVEYYRDGIRMAEGRVTGEGIRCKCCQENFSVSNFEIHAIGTPSQPSANIIFCNDGKSLQQRQIELFTKEVICRQQHQNNEEEDDICSVCHSHGTLLLCDQCPSAFHSRCIGLKEDPDDAVWCCPSCCCRICGWGEDSGDTTSIDKNVISCYQCECRYHMSCLRVKDFVPDGYPKGYWFCNRKCEQISFALERLVGKPIQVGADSLTWTLLKYVNPNESDQDPSDIVNLAENYSRLNVALDVMHECFEPVEEPRTRSDLVKDVIFNRWSKLNRLNFRGFYTVLLEKNDELVSTATVRIYGEKVAEIPLVATRFLYRRQGMCRILLNELENVLGELGVERLVLPAVPSLLNTWTSSFGFSVMPQSDRLKLLDYTFLNFQGTTLCQKLLSKNPCTELSPLKTIAVANDNINADLERRSGITGRLQADQVVGLRSGNLVGDSGISTNCGDKVGLSGLVSSHQTTGFKFIPSWSKISLKRSVEGTDCKEDENCGNDKITCCKRRKIAKPVGAQVAC